MEFLGHTLQTAGGVMIGVTVILVHRRVRKEHKIDTAVYKSIEREQFFGLLGIFLLIVGYFLLILS